MKFYSFLIAFAASVSAVSGALIAAGAPDTTVCASEKIAYETYVGKDHNVKLTYSHCADAPLVAANGHEVAALDKRQSNNVCGAACNTYCWSPSGGGPSESDCTVIADALLYDSQNIGVLFNVTATGTPTDKITMQYGSCLTYFLNQDFTTLVYCRTEWSKLVNWLASDCDASNNAHGGLCVATDQRWYVQVQHS
ncbi:hypothetical protein ONZ51_g630 [Trametes cubensis]|uniref:Uncharacterized protein n=1 Tax=Trametes cubensis TaxID=1111947 RepID=A0AAD7U5L7_9APHY|nr:hypothetical protein ONZ51_g630 [Trametes cubensis]